MFRRPNHTIDETQAGRERGVARFYRRYFWYADEEHPVSGRIELLLQHRREGHGFGIVLGRNGSESDLGLDIHLGKLMSCWIRIRSPWTRRFRDDRTYDALHYGVRFGRVGWVELMWRHPEMGSVRDGRWTLSARHFLGRNRVVKETLDGGACEIPLPEGTYGGTWTSDRHTTYYTGWLGRLRDAVFGPRVGDVGYWIDIPGGIPVEGKGENSWDCGMDGIFGTGGRTLDDAIGNVVAAVTRNRNRYGGPHDLERPMSVAEAGNRERR